MVALRRRSARPDQAPALSLRVTASSSRVLGLTVIDQGFSSLSNFALAGIVAHYSHAHQLGIYAIVASVYILVQGVVRSATSDCMLTRSETDDDVMARYERAGYLSAFIASSASSVLIVVACLFLSHAFVGPMLVFAICFPFVSLQDFSRYIGISRHDPAYAIRLDVAWLVLFIAAFVVEKHLGHTSLTWLIGAWSATGGLVGIWTLRRNLHLRHAGAQLRFWLQSEGSIGWKFAGQFMLSSSWSYVIFFLLAFVLSVSAIGIFKLGQLAMGPLSVASVGLQSAMISMAAKKFPAQPIKTLRFIFGVASGTAVVTAAWMLLAFYAPIHFMTKALGPTWPEARHIVIYVGLGYIIASWTGAGAAGLRALRAAKENLWLAFVLIPFLMVPCLLGANIDGLHGAVVGAVIANGFNCVFTWAVLVWAARRLKRRTGTTPDPEPELGPGQPELEPDPSLAL
jgi:O-antigen/teichoic acid export membrane protein